MSTVINILFVMEDQLRWDDLTCYGHPHLYTPNIDKLAFKGVRFDPAHGDTRRDALLTVTKVAKT